MPSFSDTASGRRRPDEAEEPSGLDDKAELPLTPEEDMPVIPDDERVFDMPS